MTDDFPLGCDYYATWSQRSAVLKQIAQYLPDSIVIGGFAYQALMAEFGFSLNELRYVKDLDLFVKNARKSVKILNDLGYEKIYPPGTPYGGRRRKTKVGTMKLPDEEEVCIYFAVDIIGQKFLSRKCYEDKKEAVAEHLEDSAFFSDIYGEKIRFQGAESFLLIKLLNMYRNAEVCTIDASDVVNLLQNHKNGDGMAGFAKNVLGKENFRKRINDACKKMGACCNLYGDLLDDRRLENLITVNGKEFSDHLLIKPVDSAALALV